MFPTSHRRLIKYDANMLTRGQTATENSHEAETMVIHPQRE